MTDLITEARELATENISQPTVFYKDKSQRIMLRLCDALEKAELAATVYEKAHDISNNDYFDLLEKIPRWISVTERLPTGCGYYLSVVERIAPDELGGNNTRVKIMRWTGEDWRYSVHIPEWINEAITETVTHWMPLPAAPEEGAAHERD